MKNIPDVFVGVDVSKKHLDVHMYPIHKDLRIENTDEGIQGLIKLLSDYKIIQVVLEPTGGYEKNLMVRCKKAKLAVWMVNPKRIRGFIVSEGINAKTDKIDAHMLALFAAKKERPSNANSETTNDTIKSLVRRRDDLVVMIGAEKVRACHPSQVFSKAMIEKHIAFMEKQIASIEKCIEKKIVQDENLNTTMTILTSVPGVGRATASKLIAEMPELGKISNKKAAALLGVAPMVRQSGTSKGKATICGGRQQIRYTIYMAGMVAATHNTVLRDFYKRLKAAGKASKVAIVAVMRKLIVILNTMLRNGEAWKTDPSLA